MGIDIIIPIYNAYSDLNLCLESIYKNTDLSRNRLILINDCSTDKRIKEYLDEQSEKENVIVIHNESNMGFSNNINLGMSQSETNDVILLNSDTVVTPNWIEKMVRCAYSSTEIGTVTPLSNNATLCSVPNFCEENVLPEGMGIEQAANIVEGCSLKRYPRITVAHGFCMLIKREVIQSVGKFDAETFGRGYGEENDFCNRAEQMGYIHVMCDDTYIYHSGTKSFVSAEKEKYIKEHERILQERYSKQMHNNAIHCQDNPNGWVGKNIGYHMDIWNGRENILYLLQSDFREGADDNVGGTQLHVKHLVMKLRKTRNIFVAARDKDFLQVTAYTCNNEHVFRFYIGEKEAFPVLRNRELSEIFHDILIDFKIDLVHVHHVYATSFDIYYEADKLKIPVVFTVHDFYCVCPNEKLIDKDGQVCIEKQNPDCASCLRNKKDIFEKNEYKNMWRRCNKEVLELCQCIITPSKSTKDILDKYYPDISDRIRVIEHGMDKPQMLYVDEDNIENTDILIWKPEKIRNSAEYIYVEGTAYLKSEQYTHRKVILKVTDSKGKILYVPTNFEKIEDVVQTENRFSAYIPNVGIDVKGHLELNVILKKNETYYINPDAKQRMDKSRFEEKEQFKVAFIGGINEEKGGKAVAEIIKKGSKDIQWYVFGGVGEKSLAQIQRDNLVKTGYYHEEDISTFLKIHKIDVVCILSKWPETFSYTLSEAWINNIPTITTNIGALGQRTNDNKLGLLVSPEEGRTADEVLKAINQLKDNKSAYDNLYNELKNYNHKDVETMSLEYSDFYDNIIKQNKEIKVSKELTESQRQFMINSYVQLTSSYMGEGALISKLHAMENRIRRIDNNATIKIMLKLTEREFPFKNTIKKFLMRVIK